MCLDHDIGYYGLAVDSRPKFQTKLTMGTQHPLPDSKAPITPKSVVSLSPIKRTAPLTNVKPPEPFGKIQFSVSNFTRRLTRVSPPSTSTGALETDDSVRAH